MWEIGHSCDSLNVCVSEERNICVRERPNLFFVQERLNVFARGSSSFLCKRD